jgi:hypothetical protein
LLDNIESHSHLEEVPAMPTFTREELYELVWSQPISTLAPQFGISDVGLAKMCRRERIPIPERGYWAKIQAGKSPSRIPLLPRGPGEIGIVSIGDRGSWRKPEPTTLEELEPVPAAPVFQDSLDDVRLVAKKMLGDVVPPKSFKRCHPIVSKLLQEDEQRLEQMKRADSYLFRRPLFDTKPARRRLLIIKSLFVTLQKAGYGVSLRQQAEEISVQVGHQHVGMTLIEVRHAPRRGKDTLGVVVQPQQSLRLEITTSIKAPDVVTSWEDTESARLEDRIYDIAVDTIVYGEHQYRSLALYQHTWQVEERTRQEARIRQRLEEETRRNEEERLRKKKERLDRLLVEASNLRQASEVRSYVSAVQGAVSEGRYKMGRQDLEDWSRWALEQADDLDPIKSRAIRMS